MAKEITTVSMLDILPPNLLRDEKMSAAAKAIDEELQKVADNMKWCLYINRTDELPETALDLLAWQWHVDFYEPLGMDIETKRRIIKNSIPWHRIKGTPAAVEQVVSSVFDTSQVKEWFEYGGKPYCFKIVTEYVTTDNDELNAMKRAINAVKNTRSWLDGIEFLLHLQDTETITEISECTLNKFFIEQYRWRGRYANGAYLAMAPVMADGEYIADGTLIANGALPNREENYYFPYIADGEYMADGTLTADCAHQTGAIYADSLEPDLLNVGGIVANTDAYSVLLYADGKWLADGTMLAGYNAHCQDAPITIDAQETLNDSESMTDNQSTAIGLCEQENSPLANMYYADGTWMAGPALEADGLYIADGEILANGLRALHSQYAAPVTCDGTYLADGTRFPAARPLAGNAESDENKNESLSMFQTMTASDAISAAEADGVDVAISAHDWLDNGYLANGDYLADGAIMATGNMVRDNISAGGYMSMSDSIISMYYADGENIADGHIKGGETAGARDSMIVMVGLGRLADGSALANAGGAIYADGSYIADGAYTAMQFRLARHIADGSISADGSHIPGRGGDLCDYTYFAA